MVGKLFLCEHGKVEVESSFVGLCFTLSLMRCLPLSAGVLVLPPPAARVALTLPRLANFTSAAVALSGEQRAQLEYVMLLWLTGTPHPLTSFTAVKGA